MFIQHAVWKENAFSASAKLQWAKPGFWEINGDEPSLADLLLGVPGNSGGGVYTSGSITANIFFPRRMNFSLRLDGPSISMIWAGKQK